jgi:hypothetical protein
MVLEEAGRAANLECGSFAAAFPEINASTEYGFFSRLRP